MVRMSLETRQRVITLHSRGHTVSEIRRRLREEKSTQSLYNLLRKFRREKGTTADLPRQRRPRKITEEMRVLIEQELTNNDELTSTGIRSLLMSRWPDLRVSVATIKRTRKEMGWVCTRPHYCQLLREVSVLLTSLRGDSGPRSKSKKPAIIDSEDQKECSSMPSSTRRSESPVMVY